MTARMTIVALAAVLAGCDTTDPRMGLAAAHNMAAQRAAVQATAAPLEGGSGARGVRSMQRYLTGNVPQPSVAAPVAGDAAASPATARP